MSRFIRVLFVFAAVATSCAVVFAGEDDDLIDDFQNQPPQGLQLGAVAVRNVSVNIDNWVWGGRRNGVDGPQWLESLLKVRTQDVVRSANLSEAQKEKLLLAGQGDIRRFLERVGAIKSKYSSGEAGPNIWQNIFQELKPLQSDLRRGLFNKDSLFAKTLTKTLSSEQTEQYGRAEGERRAFQHRARVDLTVMRVGTYLGLRDDQRKQLTKLLMEKTRPLPSLGEQDHDHFIGLAQMSLLPENTLKPLFDETQWRELQHLFQRVPQVMPMLQDDGIDLREERASQKHKVEKRIAPAGVVR